MIPIYCLFFAVGCSDEPSGDAGIDADGDADVDDGCSDGCLIGDICYEVGEENPDNSCQRCAPTEDSAGWSDVNGLSCDDGAYCTVSDVCFEGECRGEPRDCDDLIACNGVEVCDEEAGSCQPGESQCGDDEVCDPLLDRCVLSCDGCAIAGVCYEDGAVHPSTACRICDVESDAEGWSNNDGATCDDDVFCNGADSCSDGLCQAHEGEPCAEGETCSEDEERCCTEAVSRACDAHGDVVWVDDCGGLGAVAEDCSDEHGGCVDGECVCDAGWLGDDCDRCVVHVDGESGDDGASGNSWAEALATVGAGLEAARVGGCEVWVAAGVYLPTETEDRSATFQLWEGVTLYGGFAGTEASLDERDPLVNVTTLSGDIGVAGLPTDNVFHVVTGADEAGIDGFVITGGQADGEAGDSRGGGMLNSSVSPEVVDCVFRENSAVTGGGMFNALSTAMVTRCLFEDNQAGFGGGVHNDGAAVVFTDCEFRGNLALERGGGMRNLEAMSTIRGGLFSENSASYGGAMANGGSLTTVTNVELTSNVALEDGGAFYDNGSTQTIMGGCLISGNSAGVLGGGFLGYEAQPIVHSTAFVENNAGGDGGAVVLERSPEASFVSCLFAGNGATNNGGALHFDDADPWLRGCTISGNIAGGEGGGIWNNDDEPLISNSIIWGNSAPTAALSDWQIAGDFLLIRNSAVQGGYPGEDVYTDDPLLDSATAALLPSSPYIGVGDSYELEADRSDVDGDGDSLEALPVDVAGQPRVVGENIDLGAYELQADGVEPSIVELRFRGEETILVVFDEPLDELSATDIANYTLDSGVTVIEAALGKFGRIVELTTDTIAACSVDTLRVSGVEDVMGNAVVAGTHVTFQTAELALSEDFEDGDYDGWTAYDEGASSGPSDWEVIEGELVQNSNIFGWSGGGSHDDRRGAYVYWDSPSAFAWTDYDFSATFRTDDDDGIGVMFRFQDVNNFYRLDFDDERFFFSLIRVRGGVFSEMTWVPLHYPENEDVTIRVSLRGAEIQVYVDEALQFGGPVIDPDPIPTGTVALYTWANDGGTFDDVWVSASCP